VQEIGTLRRRLILIPLSSKIMELMQMAPKCTNRCRH